MDVEVEVEETMVGLRMRTTFRTPRFNRTLQDFRRRPRPYRVIRQIMLPEIGQQPAAPERRSRPPRPPDLQIVPNHAFHLGIIRQTGKIVVERRGVDALQPAITGGDDVREDVQSGLQPFVRAGARDNAISGVSERI